TEKLLELLKASDERVRYRVRTELHARPTEEVMAATNKWVDAIYFGEAGERRADAGSAHNYLEALWLSQAHNVLSTNPLKSELQSTDYHARAAAVRVLCQWRDRVPNSLDLLKQAAADKHPRVRLEAVRAASFWQEPEAAEVPLIAAELPTDQYIDFVTKETMKVLEPILKSALAANKPGKFTTEAGARYLLPNIA